MRCGKDILVVGGGIAGMAYAVRLAMNGRLGDHRIRIISKAPVDRSNSYAAQGGVAAVTSAPDTIEQHVADTLCVGGGRSIPSVVRTIVSEGPACINELVGMGARFDADAQGLLHLTTEGGHSRARVVHHLDRTGAEIVRTLLAQVKALNIDMLPGQRAIDLITVERAGLARCTGIRTLNVRTGAIVDRPAALVVLATGGAGQVYRHTTNPPSATGDGIAMALRAGVPLREMAFVQFHPTALFTGAEGTVPLVSEVVRGAGAVLRDGHGHPFMRDEHPSADLAPRNVVARAIHRRMLQEGTRHVWLDASAMGPVAFKRRFPAIARECERYGIVPGRDPIPVMPAAHYLCGGVRTDDRGHTSMEGLLALGECASTGLHGADRLASNSLLEALVVPRRAADLVTIPAAAEGVVTAMDDAPLPGHAAARCAVLRAQLRGVMTEHVGIVRRSSGLVTARAEIGAIVEEVEELWGQGRINVQLAEVRDLAEVAWAIAVAAGAEAHSVGTHCVEEGSVGHVNETCRE
jgi:L-aspartate oxidase